MAAMLGGGLAGMAAADWPAHRGGVARAGYAPVRPAVPLTEIWTHRSGQAPRPAWPAPARGSFWQRLDRLESRLTDDWVFHPVMADDAVFYGSSAEDQVVCLEAATGAVRWVFVSDGPVRYAPVVAGGRVFFGSDDGHVYAVEARDGRLVWRQRLGPRDHRIPGNERLISAWPVRTGLVVLEGVVYATAGLYPGQGVYAVALEAGTGAVVWRQELEHSPQGYLMATPTRLLVPTGRANPIALDRTSGRFLRAYDGVGGSFALVTDGELVAGRGNDGALEVSDLESRERLVQFRGRQMAVTPRFSYLLTGTELVGLDRLEHGRLTREVGRLTREIRELQALIRESGTGAGAVSTLREALAKAATDLETARRDLAACELFRVPANHPHSLVATDTLVFAGGTDEVAVHAAGTGERVWTQPVEGEAHGLAVADGRLLVSTHRGVLQAFGFGADPAPERPPPVVEANATEAPADVDSGGIRRLVERLLEAGGAEDGYALVVGVGSGRLAIELARQTRLRVVGVDSDPARVGAVRERVRSAGLYGTRVTVHPVAGETLPFTDYVANLVVSESGLVDGVRPDWEAGELKRVLRPFGGVLWVDRTELPYRRGALAGAGGWTHQFGNPANTANSGDVHVTDRLRLQWFGGPGPARMVDRHLRAPAPLAGGGWLIVPGENLLIGVDAYNGTELWSVELPGSQRYSMPYDAGYLSLDGDVVAVAVRDDCWLIDAATGRVVRRLNVPALEGIDAGHWGYTLRVEGRLFGTIQRSTASRTEPTYALIDADYNNHQPLVTGRALFRLAEETGRAVWRYECGVILNPTVTFAGDRFTFIESRGKSALEHPTGRIPLMELMAADPFLVALRAEDGRLLWERPLDAVLRGSENILYLVHDRDRLFGVGSRPHERDTQYRVGAFAADTGRRLWVAEHLKGAPGEFTHGEQVHHPVVIGDILFAEPVLYDRASGRALGAEGSDQPWRLRRPGHSCGTMSGAGECVFFRAGNPTVLDVMAHLREGRAPVALAPSRPGCWINIIPANGLVLIPEASAGCVCHFSLQTSMGFLPTR